MLNWRTGKAICPALHGWQREGWNMGGFFSLPYSNISDLMQVPAFPLNSYPGFIQPNKQNTKSEGLGPKEGFISGQYFRNQGKTVSHFHSWCSRVQQIYGSYAPARGAHFVSTEFMHFPQVLPNPPRYLARTDLRYVNLKIPESCTIYRFSVSFYHDREICNPFL